MPKPEVTEAHVKECINKILKIFMCYNPIYTLCPMTFGYGESGHPDRLLLINGTLIGIEAKRNKNNYHCRPELKPKPNEVMQARQAKKIEEAGGFWVCIHKDNLFTLPSLLDEFATTKIADFSDEHKLELDHLAYL